MPEVPGVDEQLSPLERALIDRFDRAIRDMTTEIRALRRQAPDRLMVWMFLGLWGLTAFLIGILALTKGVDPRVAAEAVNVAAEVVSAQGMPK